MTNYVFVYGTLKKGFSNNRVLGSAKFVGSGITVSSDFKMMDGGFPMVLSGGLFKVKGELFEVSSDDTMKNLDRLEGVPTLFTRETVDIALEDSSVIKSFMYVGNKRFQGSHANFIVPNDNNECEWEPMN